MATKLFEVREKLAAATAEYRKIINKEADLGTDETLPTEDTDRLSVLKADIEVLKARVDRLESLETLPPDGNDATDDSEKSFAPTVKQFSRATSNVFAQPKVKLEKGFAAARFIMGLVMATKNGGRAAADYISKSFNDDIVAKALISVSSTGATTIPTLFSEEIIELLRSQVAVRNAGATVLDTSSGNLTIPRLAGSSTAQWQAENTDIANSSQTVDNVVLGNHKLTAMVSVSNDLIKRAIVGVESLVRDDLVAVLARAEDIAFISGAGGTSPTGLKLQSGIQSFYAAGSDITSVVSAVQGAVTKLQMSNTRMIRPAWIMTPNARNFIASLRDGVGGYFALGVEINNSNTLCGYPIFTTTQIPSNLANYIGGSSGTAGTDIYLADFADVLIGDTMGLQIDSTNVGAWYNGTAYQSNWSQDSTSFRVIKETDLALRHPTSVVLLKADSWKLV